MNPSAEANNRLPQRAIVHVYGTLPEDLSRIDPELVTEVQMVVEHRRQQVVGGTNGV